VLSEYTRQATLASWNGKTNTGILDHAHEGHETFHGAAQISCCVEESRMTHFDSRPGCHTGPSLPSKYSVHTRLFTLSIGDHTFKPF